MFHACKTLSVFLMIFVAQIDISGFPETLVEFDINFGEDIFHQKILVRPEKLRLFKSVIFSSNKSK